MLAGPGPDSWPIVIFSSILFRSVTMSLSEATALVDWIWWIQTDPSALRIANRYNTTLYPNSN